MCEDKASEALIADRNPTVDWAAKARYRKVLLDPVMIWRGKNFRVQGLDQKEGR
jgi:hypothetical protein